MRGPENRERIKQEKRDKDSSRRRKPRKEKRQEEKQARTADEHGHAGTQRQRRAGGCSKTGTSNKKVCDYCGVFGHIAKDCRKKKSDEADGAAASADAKE